MPSGIRYVVAVINQRLERPPAIGDTPTEAPRRGGGPMASNQAKELWRSRIERLLATDMGVTA